LSASKNGCSEQRSSLSGRLVWVTLSAHEALIQPLLPASMAIVIPIPHLQQSHSVRQKNRPTVSMSLTTRAISVLRHTLNKLLLKTVGDNKMTATLTRDSHPSPTAASTPSSLAVGAKHPETIGGDTGSLRPSVVQMLMNLANGLAAEIDLDGKILALSDTMATLLDLPREFLAHQGFFELVHPEDVERVRTCLIECFRGTPSGATVRMSRGLTDQLWVQLKVLRCSDDNLSPTFAVWGQDITELKAGQEQLRALALHDPLTGLGNRMMLKEHIARAISNGETNGMQFAIVLLDLDGFKRVNDSLGHFVGDELLKSAANRLMSALRNDDVVTRMGGDEFVIVLNGTSSVKTLQAVGTRILTAIERPFKIRDMSLHVTTSIGVAVYPDHGNSEEALLKHADLAMYRAKAKGKNTIEVFNESMADEQSFALSLESGMFEGFRTGEFCLHYQPICDPHTKSVRGVEALMRWNRGGRMVPPTDFIPLAEQSTFINLLGEWALRTACMQMAQWDKTGLPLQYMSVNVSPRQFLFPGFPKAVWQALADSGIAGNRLMLEITESTLTQNPARATEVSGELIQLGVRFAVDDFGTGYSSLSYLKNFPLSVLKIDRSFIKDMPQSESDQKIVSAVLGLARELGLTTVGEGVETDEHRTMLRDKGCTAIQGYLVSRPLPATELERKLVAGELVFENNVESVSNEESRGF
jgi:diguanylate cyclase